MSLSTRTDLVSARAPFDLSRTLSFACSFTPTAGEQDAEHGRWTKALFVDGRPVVVDVAPTSDPSVLRHTTSSPDAIDDALHARAIERARFVLSLDDDLAPFYALARTDPSFAPIARAQHGFHHPKFASVTEIACWAVLAQRTPMRIARRTKDAITERWGAQIRVGDRVLRAFPDAKRLAAVSADDLSRVVPIALKAERIATIARELAWIGDADAHLRALPFSEAERWLGALPGIGAWSTAFVLFRGLGRMERASLEGPLLDCARRVYGPTRSAGELARVAARYGEHVGHWALYLRTGAGTGRHAPARRARTAA